MTGDEVREVFEAMLPQEEIDHFCQPFGVIERQRQLTLGMFVRAMVISAGSEAAPIRRMSCAPIWSLRCPRVARSACSRWFDAPLEQGMEALAQRGLAYAHAQQVDLSGPLCGVKDWYIVDSTTVKGADALRRSVPGLGTRQSEQGPSGGLGRLRGAGARPFQPRSGA